MSDVSFNVIGFPAANAGLTATLRNVSGAVIATAPVLPDGTVNVRNIAPGSYQVALTHLNLPLMDVAVQTIHVMAQGETRVVMMIDPKKFTNTAITDVVDVNLNPLIDESASIKLRAAGLGNKQGGEIFTAADYNSLAGAVRDLAGVVGALLHGVTPVGHNHFEYENKLTELSTNFQELLQTLTTATLQMQRRFEIQKLRSRVEDVLEVATGDNTAARKTALGKLTEIESSISDSPTLYSQKTRAAAVVINGAIDAAVKTLENSTDAGLKQIAANYRAVVAEWLKRSFSSQYSEVMGGTLPAPYVKRFEVNSGFLPLPLSD